MCVSLFHQKRDKNNNLKRNKMKTLELFRNKISEINNSSAYKMLDDKKVDELMKNYTVETKEMDGCVIHFLCEKGKLEPIQARMFDPANEIENEVLDAKTCAFAYSNFEKFING